MEDKMILLVEDRTNDEALTLRALRKYHVANRVVVVRDGAEALDFLFCRGVYIGRDPQERPKVILLDLRRPKLGGLEVLRRIRAGPQMKTQPIILLTTSQEEQDVISRDLLGANAYLRKPVDFHQFVTATCQLGLHWVIGNELPNLSYTL